MLVQVGALRYEWIDAWARLPLGDRMHAAWPHHGLAVTSAGELLTFHPAERCLLTLDAEGGVLTRSGPVEVDEAHGITLVQEDGTDYVWLADAQRHRDPQVGYQPPASADDSAVVKTSIDGRTVQRLPRPPHPAYEHGQYRPTMVAVDERRFGGSGDLWVADGYGESFVHRFDAEGNYRASLSGEEGAGRFHGPHAVFIDRRRDEPELYVADRMSGRIQVYDLAGRFRRVVGAGFLSTPTCIATDGQRLFIVEFRPPRLTLLDREDQLIGYLCEQPEASARDGWPNALKADGTLVRPPLTPGLLNSPHAVAVDPRGDLYLTEWLIGGRFTKLRKA